MTWPDIYYLDEQNRPALERFLQQAGWLEAGERISNAARAGQGNMNYVLRAQTTSRSFILKQSRPWVEKYPQIAAPFDRALVEAEFYNTVRAVPVVANAMPRLLGFHREAHILQLADLGDYPNFEFLYAGKPILDAEHTAFESYLNSLHESFRDAELRGRFANTAMRELNHEHIFSLPFRAGNQLDLDAVTVGLAALARELQSDAEVQRRAAELGRIYLEEGTCLIHGDFFPGSWIRVPDGVRVIDPEFCFFGPPEFDWGVMAAHFLLAGMSGEVAFNPTLDRSLVSRFTAIEILRRLIGVAQLPLTIGLERKRMLLQQAREMLLQNE